MAVFVFSSSWLDMWERGGGGRESEGYWGIGKERKEGIKKSGSRYFVLMCSSSASVHRCVNASCPTMELLSFGVEEIRRRMGKCGWDAFG